MSESKKPSKWERATAKAHKIGDRGGPLSPVDAAPTPEERARRCLPSTEGLWSSMIPFAAKAIREAEQAARSKTLEEALRSAHLVAEEYNVARERFPKLARKYADMRDGALAAETAIRALAKDSPHAR